MDPELTDEQIRSATTRELKDSIEVMAEQRTAYRSMESLAIRSHADAAVGYCKTARLFESVIERIRHELSRREELVRDGATGWPVIVSFLAVMVGTMRMPYAYYQFMRGGFCVLLICLSFLSGGTKWLILSLPLIALYNPVSPVVLGSKDLWTTINVITLVTIGGLLHAITKKKVDAGSSGN